MKAKQIWISTNMRSRITPGVNSVIKWLYGEWRWVNVWWHVLMRISVSRRLRVCVTADLPQTQRSRMTDRAIGHLRPSAENTLPLSALHTVPGSVCVLGMRSAWMRRVHQKHDVCDQLNYLLMNMHILVWIKLMPYSTSLNFAQYLNLKTTLVELGVYWCKNGVNS